MTLPPWRHVWITGASSGIGEALAVALSNADVQVSVSARSADKLKQLEAAHDRISAFPADVTDADQIASAVLAMEARNGPIDLAILNAGTWSISDVEDLSMDSFRKAVDVNYLGVATALTQLVGGMRHRGGQIAVVSSVAGYRGLPGSAYYGPTKAALNNLCESLQPDLQHHNIKLQIINPGFVRTPATDRNDFPMPFLIEVDDAAARIIKGLKSNRFEIAFPWQLVMILKLGRILPLRLYLWITRNWVSRS